MTCYMVQAAVDGHRYIKLCKLLVRKGLISSARFLLYAGLPAQKIRSAVSWDMQGSTPPHQHHGAIAIGESYTHDIQLHETCMHRLGST